MAKRIFLVVVVLVAGLGVPAYAWDSFGHMAVACVAYQKLTPEAKTRVNALLKLNPNYDKWVSWVPANTSAADKDMMVFMLAATWPDEIKSDPSYSPNDKQDPSANKGYAEMVMHKSWHFVDTPFSTDDTPLPAIPTPNAQERIALFRGVLASGSDDQLKSYDLTWLLHLVGDVHQPLHCGTRVSKTDPGGDHGGNNVKLNCPACGSELHGFWDGLLGSSKGEQAALLPVIKAVKKLRPADATLAAKSDEKEWVAESFQETKETVYQPPIGDGDGPFSLTPEYIKTAKALGAQRVALAGARLANLINNELK